MMRNGEREYKNILILNLRKIGDTIMATSTAYLLKQAYPEAKVTMLVKPSNESMVRNNPVIDDVVLYNYSHKEKVKGLRLLAKDLKARNFDCAVVVDNKPRSALIAFMAGIPVRYGYEKITSRNWYLKFLYTKIIPVGYDAMTVQQVKNHELFINAITGKDMRAKMVMPTVSESEQRQVDKLLVSDKKLKIGLCIRSGVPFKDYSKENFAQVVNALGKEYDAGFFVVGSKADIEYVDEFRKLVDANLEVHNCCGKTSLPQLGYFLSKLDFMLSVDTGTAHIGAAVGLKELVIFAGISHIHWGPYGETVEYVYPEELECYPCDDKMRKVCKGYRCLDIEGSKIVKKCEALLGER